MIPSRRDFLASLAALATPTVASGAAPTLGIADLRADAALAVRAYDTLHPGLRRYNTPDQFAGHVAALHRALDREQTLGEAYLAFSVFAASLRCGHTYANFYNQARATRLALFEGANRLPVHFVWLDRRMIVTRNFSADARLVPGSEIVAIDGVPTSEILRRLMTVARADGGIAGLRGFVASHDRMWETSPRSVTRAAPKPQRVSAGPCRQPNAAALDSCLH